MSRIDLRTCRCCGIPINPAAGVIRLQVRVCIDCDDCDQLHGAKLQGVLWQAVQTGKLDPYTALARMLIDDAQMTGRIVHVVKDGRVANIVVINPPRRWEVIAGRSLRDALQFVDPTIMDVEVTTTMDALEPGSLRIEIKAKTPTLGTAIPGAPDVDIPADIMSRKRAEA